VIAPTRPPSRGARRESRGTSSPFAPELAPPRRDVPAAYLVLVGLPMALTAVALAIGTRLPARAGIAPTALPTGATTSGFDLALFMLQVVVIVAVAQLVGAAVARIGQPRVIGEIRGGLLLGPLLLDRVAPELSQRRFPAASLGFINALGGLAAVHVHRGARARRLGPEASARSA
jgi:hypothetical protein